MTFLPRTHAGKDLKTLFWLSPALERLKKHFFDTRPHGKELKNNFLTFARTGKRKKILFRHAPARERLKKHFFDIRPHGKNKTA